MVDIHRPQEVQYKGLESLRNGGFYMTILAIIAFPILVLIELLRLSK